MTWLLTAYFAGVLASGITVGFIDMWVRHDRPSFGDGQLLKWMLGWPFVGAYMIGILLALVFDLILFIFGKDRIK